MGYFIGIDGGGTKTEVALCDEAGRVLYRSVAAGCNPVDIGLERTLELLNHILRELLEKSGIAACQIAAVFSGISGGSAAEIQDICRGGSAAFFQKKRRWNAEVICTTSSTAGFYAGMAVLLFPAPAVPAMFVSIPAAVRSEDGAIFLTRKAAALTSDVMLFRRCYPSWTAGAKIPGSENCWRIS